MNRFAQIHLLTAYPPANLNRDDLGRPKTARMGGAERLRVSSQSLKRAWRTSAVFQEALAGHVGKRTKELGIGIYERFTESGVDAKKAREWTKLIAATFGKLKASKKDKPLNDLEIEQLAHFSPVEIAAVDALVAKLAEEKRAPTEAELEILRKNHQSADIALFGRMLAAAPSFNVEAAAQVAHAVTVHKVAVEDDFFTAVDDLNPRDEDLGAGHMGITEFGAGLFYLYICIDRALLVENLKGDKDLASQAIAALVEAAATVAPTGKQASFGSRARASYVFCETGDAQPRSLVSAFLKPVEGQDQFSDAVESLEKLVKAFDQAYGDGASATAKINVAAGTGSLKEVIACASELGDD
ncbi:MAG TPA: type I-E CRISPR-associated protein Cas7/Cse4/CasC [Gammaproteobacteria bacterium]|nr:type I-E CRISPR-associated protein Cas7/Cse4/CasC [Gammaproteobacteria bacterium]